jgi:hypothetical protein
MDMIIYDLELKEERKINGRIALIQDVFGDDHDFSSIKVITEVEIDDSDVTFSVVFNENLSMNYILDRSHYYNYRVFYNVNENHNEDEIYDLERDDNLVRYNDDNTIWFFDRYSINECAEKLKQLRKELVNRWNKVKMLKYSNLSSNNNPIQQRLEIIENS